MKKVRKYSFTQKLTANNLCLIIGINMLLPVVSVRCISLVIGFQLSHYIIDSVSVSYLKKLFTLMLLLDAVFLGVIDYLNVFQPFLRLNKIVEEYVELTGIKTDDEHDSKEVKSALEKKFKDMLAIQKKNDIQAKQKENQMQTTELYALQTQINPHFLYNTLDSIRGYAVIHQVYEIADMTEALSKLFRSMIAKEGKLLRVKEEFESVKNYIAIQDFRFQHKFHYECEVEREIMEEYLIPNMSLQPLVENAIMHGLEQKMGMGIVRITGYVTEKRLVLNVWDNGIGISEKKLRILNERILNWRETESEKNRDDHTGIALMNINKRIKLQFGEEFGIYIMSTPEISTVTELTLPAIRVDEYGEKNYGERNFTD